MRKNAENHTWQEEPCSSFREEVERKMERTKKKRTRNVVKVAKLADGIA